MTQRHNTALDLTGASRPQLNATFGRRPLYLRSRRRALDGEPVEVIEDGDARKNLAGLRCVTDHMGNNSVTTTSHGSRPAHRGPLAFPYTTRDADMIDAECIS